jgi:exosortase
MEKEARPVALPSSRTLLILAAIGGLLLWAYWTTLGELAHLWSHDPQYSHGYLVPAFALYLLWRRRRQLANVSAGLNVGGLLLLAAGTALRLAGSFFFLPWLDVVSLLPCLAGVCVLLGGWRSLRWSWPALGFLLFMLPLPYRFQVALAQPLQRLATQASTYLLQTLGSPAVAEGNIITINDVRIGVVEACNGLSMLVTFFALSAAVAMLLRGHWIYRAVIVVSALPIALASNVIRIVVTAVLHEKVGSEVANIAFHDAAGFFMMPLALAMMGVELWLLRRVLVEQPQPGRGTSAKRQPQPAVARTSRVRTGRPGPLVSVPPA